MDAKIDNTMEPRAPDLYHMDQMVDTEPQDPQDPTEPELEQAMLASLEESWACNKIARDKWTRFQPLLEQVKRVGAFDKTIQQVYDLLSILLYQYAHGIDALVPVESLDLIESQLKSVRLTDRTLLQEVMGHLRSSL